MWHLVCYGGDDLKAPSDRDDSHYYTHISMTESWVFVVGGFNAVHSATLEVEELYLVVVIPSRSCSFVV